MEADPKPNNNKEKGTPASPSPLPDPVPNDNPRPERTPEQRAFLKEIGTGTHIWLVGFIEKSNTVTHTATTTKTTFTNQQHASL